MSNLLLEDIEYKIDETPGGVWRRYAYPTGEYFSEYKSHMTFVGLPLVHYTHGKCPETGHRIIAKGVIAIGRLAVGHASFGVCAVGQLALGVGFGLGQAATGIAAIGQGALGLLLGAGQLVTGYIAIGQLGLGKYVLAQSGVGEFVLSVSRTDPEAVAFFKNLLPFF